MSLSYRSDREEPVKCTCQYRGGDLHEFSLVA